MRSTKHAALQGFVQAEQDRSQDLQKARLTPWCAYKTSYRATELPQDFILHLPVNSTGRFQEGFLG
jgi:hypothetical protein